MPLTANGKVDRKALPAPVSEARAEAESERQRTAVEEIVSRDIGGGVEAREVGVDENFFELGGHSLLATQVMSRVREVLQVEVAIESAVREADGRRAGQKQWSESEARARRLEAPAIESSEQGTRAGVVVRAAEAVVHPAVGAGERGLQHPAGGEAGR